MTGNDVAWAQIGDGWSVASSSSANDLVLSGPDGMVVSATTRQEPMNQTLSDAFQSQMSVFESMSTYSNVGECGNTQNVYMPGSPATISAAFSTVCFTLTPPGGSAVPYWADVWEALVAGDGYLLQLTAIAWAPETTSNLQVTTELLPELRSLVWKQVSTR